MISHAIVENNILHDNGKLGGSAINCDGVTDAVIQNNAIDGNHQSGISLYRIDGGAPSTGNRVINNTIRMAEDARFAIKIEDGSTGNTVRNNILLAGGPGQVAIALCAACATGLVSDHNAVSDAFAIGDTALALADWRARTGQDATSFIATATALFAGVTLALAPGSPAIDRGDTAAATPARSAAPHLDAWILRARWHRRGHVEDRARSSCAANPLGYRVGRSRDGAARRDPHGRHAFDIRLVVTRVRVLGGPTRAGGPGPGGCQRDVGWHRHGARTRELRLARHPARRAVGL